MKHLLYLAFALTIFIGFSEVSSYANSSYTTQNILKAEDKTSDKALWIDEVETLDSEFSNGEASSQTSSKPFTIIGLIIFSLILVIGVMVWSIITVNSKKKTYAKPQTASKKSNFKLLDSFAIDNGKNLYLVQLFDKKYVLGSTWGSICFINEYNGEINTENLETKEAKSPTETEEKEEASSSSNLDFLTTQDNETSPLEDGFKSLIKNVTDEFTKKTDSSVLPDNPFEDTTPQKTNGRKLSSILKDEARKPSINSESKVDSLNNGQIKRSYSDNSPKVLDAYTSIKKPSWLKEREGKRTLVESIFNKNKIQNQSTAKEYLENIDNPSSTQEDKPKAESEILDLSSNKVVESESEQAQTSSNIEIKQTKRSLLTPTPNEKARKKISIVED